CHVGRGYVHTPLTTTHHRSERKLRHRGGVSERGETRDHPVQTSHIPELERPAQWAHVEAEAASGQVLVIGWSTEKPGVAPTHVAIPRGPVAALSALVAENVGA